MPFNMCMDRKLAKLKNAVFRFSLLLYVPVSSYGHVGMVSLPKPTHFFLGKLDQAVSQYFMHINALVTDNYIKKYFFIIQLLHAHLQYVCNIPAK